MLTTIHHILNQSRQEHWIIHCRQAVRGVKFKCNYFYRQTVKPQKRQMGNLPECRLEPEMVFKDSLQLIFIKKRRGGSKVYGFLFICSHLQELSILN